MSILSHHLAIFLGIFLLPWVMLSCHSHPAPSMQQPSPSLTEDFASLSSELLQKVRDMEPHQDLLDQLAQVSPQALAASLDTDLRRITFWVNAYNSYVIILLRENPALYEDRSAFFGDDRFTIAGRELSFDKVEHGILRRSKIKWGLGIIGKLSVDDYENRLRVEAVDPRIHFVLNCGAEACPPVRILEPATTDEQLHEAARTYLQASTVYDAEAEEVDVTPLMSWFRGDFGGKSGVIEMLKRYEIIPQESSPSLEFKDYNWTLDIDNFVPEQ
jgi:hypothetical protein